MTVRTRPARPAMLILAMLCLVVLSTMAALIVLKQELPRQRGASLGGPYQLEASDGRSVSDKDFRGKYVLIYFGYTSCPDICPTTMADLGIALKKLGGKADEVQPLFVTIDPRRDTPDILRSYTSAFSPRILGLTGSPQQIDSIEKEFDVYAKVEKTGSGPDDYSVDHSSIYYLMGPDGRFIAVLRADQDGEDLARVIAHYLT